MDTHSRTPGPTPSKSIHHTEPGFSPSKPAAPATGVSQTDLDPLPVAESVAHAPGAKKIEEAAAKIFGCWERMFSI